MNSTPEDAAPMSETTEIIVSTGDHYRVRAAVKEVEHLILDAARGSIMQFAWFVEDGTGDDLAVNPEHVVTLRVAGS